MTVETALQRFQRVAVEISSEQREANQRISDKWKQLHRDLSEARKICNHTMVASNNAAVGECSQCGLLMGAEDWRADYLET